MKTEKLQIGTVFKNMMDMCDQLEIEYKNSTNSRKAIMKEVEQYVELTKEGRKLIVTKVYDEKKEKIDGRKNYGQLDNRKGNNTVYGDLLDVILLDYIRMLPNISYLTINDMALITNMVNENYQLALKNRSLFSKYVENVLNTNNTTAIRNAFYNIRNIINPTIDNSIKRLTRQEYIESEYGYIVLINIDILAERLLKENGIELNNEDKEMIEQTRMVTIEEEQEIKKVEKEVLEGFGVDSIGDLNGELMTKYFSRVNNRIKKKYPEFEIVYKGYKIKHLQKVRDHNITKEESNKAKDDLLDIFLKRLVLRFEKDVRNITSKVDRFKHRTNYFGDKGYYRFTKYETEILDWNYIKDGLQIVSLLTNSNTKRLTREELRKYK